MAPSRSPGWYAAGLTRRDDGRGGWGRWGAENRSRGMLRWTTHCGLRHRGGDGHCEAGWQGRVALGDGGSQRRGECCDGWDARGDGRGVGGRGGLGCRGECDGCQGGEGEVGAPCCVSPRYAGEGSWRVSFTIFAVRHQLLTLQRRLCYARRDRWIFLAAYSPPWPPTAGGATGGEPRDAGLSEGAAHQDFGGYVLAASGL